MTLFLKFPETPSSNASTSTISALLVLLSLNVFVRIKAVSENPFLPRSKRKTPKNILKIKATKSAPTYTPNVIEMLPGLNVSEPPDFYSFVLSPWTAFAITTESATPSA